jgi:hypothetical protein
MMQMWPEWWPLHLQLSAGLLFFAGGIVWIGVRIFHRRKFSVETFYDEVGLALAAIGGALILSSVVRLLFF